MFQKYRLKIKNKKIPQKRPFLNCKIPKKYEKF